MMRQPQAKKSQPIDELHGAEKKSNRILNSSIFFPYRHTRVHPTVRRSVSHRARTLDCSSTNHTCASGRSSWPARQARFLPIKPSLPDPVMRPKPFFLSPLPSSHHSLEATPTQPSSTQNVSPNFHSNAAITLLYPPPPVDPPVPRQRRSPGENLLDGWRSPTKGFGCQRCLTRGVEA